MSGKELILQGNDFKIRRQLFVGSVEELAKVLFAEVDDDDLVSQGHWDEADDVGFARFEVELLAKHLVWGKLNTEWEEVVDYCEEYVDPVIRNGFESMGNR